MCITRGAALTRPALEFHKNTTVLAYNTKNSTSSCTAAHQKSQQIHDGGLKLKTKPGGEGQVFSSKSRRRRTSSGAELGEEGKLEASHCHQQAIVAKHNTITAQLQATGRNLAHHITASA
jgi:hypothetical protein